MSDFRFAKRGKSALDNYKTTGPLTVDSYGDQYPRSIHPQSHTKTKNGIK